MAKAEQEKLPGTDVPRPQTVRDGKIMAEYVRPHYGKDKHDRYVVGMEFSFPLTKEHEDLIPLDVERLWAVMKKGTPRRAVDLEVDPQAVEIYFAADMKPEISLLFAVITHATLTIVEETGSGKAKDVIRYSFRVEHESSGPVNETLREFADNNFDKKVWLRLSAVQGSLLKEYRKEQEEAEKKKE
jgi:hypothetical protein